MSSRDAQISGGAKPRSAAYYAELAHFCLKRKLCRYYPTRNCKLGRSCQFAHDKKELRNMPDLKKTALCKLFVEGRCPKDIGQCLWAHGEDDLRNALLHGDNSIGPSVWHGTATDHHGVKGAIGEHKAPRDILPETEFGGEMSTSSDNTVSPEPLLTVAGKDDDFEENGACLNGSNAQSGLPVEILRPQSDEEEPWEICTHSGDDDNLGAPPVPYTWPPGNHGKNPQARTAAVASHGKRHYCSTGIISEHEERSEIAPEMELGGEMSTNSVRAVSPLPIPTVAGKGDDHNEKGGRSSDSIAQSGLPVKIPKPQSDEEELWDIQTNNGDDDNVGAPQVPYTWPPSDHWPSPRAGQAYPRCGHCAACVNGSFCAVCGAALQRRLGGVTQIVWESPSGCQAPSLFPDRSGNTGTLVFLLVPVFTPA